MSNAPQLKVYLAGPMFSSGRLTENLNEAMRMAAHFISNDFAVFLPQLYIHQDMYAPQEEEVWLRQDRTFLETCDVVYRLPGYSKGADLEEVWAKEAGIPVFRYLDEVYRFRKERNAAYESEDGR